MPGIEDWINCPLPIIQGLFEQKHEEHSKKIKEYFTGKLENKKAMSWIPSLNSTPLHNLRSNSVVKFRCMVQDMFDPEFYLGVFEVKDSKTGQTSLKSGKYRDIADCLPHQEILLESPNNVTMDRQTLYCVPVPGEAQWAKEVYAQECPTRAAPSTSFSGNRTKRSLEDGGMDCELPQEGASGQAEMETEGEHKKSRTTAESASSSQSSTPDLNFPLPGEKGPACLVKIYGNGESLKVNEVIEVIGVLSTDPALAINNTEEKEQSAFMDAAEASMEGVEEQNAHSPPPSLVPRLHALVVNRLQHTNPLLPTNTSAPENKETVSGLLSEASELRSNMISMLEQSLMGDKLAAEYLLCHLISSVYSRRDVVALGKFSLNLSSSPRSSRFPQHINNLLQQLVVKSYMLPMTLENMNTLKFSPSKDYSANRLTSGVLQLSDKTHFVVDETVLQQGQLDANGVKNVTALGNVIRWQKVEYDFNFHQQDFSSDLIVLVISEGKSLLPSDVHVPIVAQPGGPQNLEERFVAIQQFLTPALLAKVRAYLGLVQLLDYNVDDTVKQMLENDFVELRKDDAKNLPVDDFHGLLVLARLLTLSHGQTTLNRAFWEKAKSMEDQRKTRVDQLPQPTNQ